MSLYSVHCGNITPAETPKEVLNWAIIVMVSKEPLCRQSVCGCSLCCWP